MIKATELRIGNWVKAKGSLHKVESMHLDKGIDLEASGGNYVSLDAYFSFYDIEPIPLTPEILKGCGWVWNEECNSYEKYPNGDARMNLSQSTINGSWQMFNYILKALIAKQIFYLHQLQNLYFALTGEELEVNLKEKTLSGN